MVESNKNQERDDLAGEYVLGTLTQDERLAFEQQMRTDADLRARVLDWQLKLEPLAQNGADVAPPSGQFEQILETIDATANPARANSGEGAAQIIRLGRNVRFWRRSTMLMGALAASLLVFVAMKEFYLPGGRGLEAGGQYGNYIAVLQGDNKAPQFVASIDIRSGRIDLVRLGEEQQSGRDYELWAVGGGRVKPVSLGVIDRGRGRETRLGSNIGQAGEEGLADTLFAISLEPRGGSITGQPSGPVLFTGKLVRTNEAR